MKILVIALLSVCFVAQGVLAAPAIYFSTARQKVIANGKEYVPNFWTARVDMGETFKNNPDAQKEYDLYQTRIKIFPWLNYGALAALLTYSIATDSDNYRSGTALTLFFVPWISGLFVVGSAQTHLTRAINIYNGVPAQDAQTKPMLQNRSYALAVPIFNYSF
jgi:hypothetical protein